MRNNHPIFATILNADGHFVHIIIEITICKNDLKRSPNCVKYSLKEARESMCCIHLASSFTDAIAGTHFFQASEPKGKALNPARTDFIIVFALASEYTLSRVTINLTEDVVAPAYLQHRGGDPITCDHGVWRFHQSGYERHTTVWFTPSNILKTDIDQRRESYHSVGFYSYIRFCGEIPPNSRPAGTRGMLRQTCVKGLQYWC